ncbi:MAG: TRAP transporter small permease [Sulfurospirillaceae bacterium]|nr:TRAP transporter small permease [Sulfurospirillaceae bacterium]MDD2826130.1 TRAP transporter small permease [Sulfurospirillaceae bacterium]
MKKILQGIDRTVTVLSVFLLVISACSLLFAIFYRYVVMTHLRELAEVYLWLAPTFHFLANSLADISTTTDEIPGYILVWISFLGAYLVEREANHIRFDMLVEAMPKRLNRLVTFIMQLLLVGFFVLLLYYSTKMIWIDGMSEIETLPIEQGWFMAILPLASVLMILSISINIYKGFACSSSLS